MRLQLTHPVLRAVAAVVASLALLLCAPQVHADDRVDTTITWFQERHSASDTLTVIHPQFNFGVDISDVVSIDGGYAADIVSGATESIYAAPRVGVDAVSTATQFSDTRHVGSFGLSLTGRRSTLSVGYAYGTERDYRSHSVNAGASVDLPGKNTNFALSYAHNFDSVCDFNNGDATPLERRALTGMNDCFVADANANTLTHTLSIDTTQATLTQNLSPTAVMQMGAFGQILDGFQSNPYRRVRVAGFDAQENIPRTRARAAIFARIKLAFPAARSVIGFHVRGYSDTWSVRGGSAEITYHQYLGKTLLVRFRARGYQQSAAAFFRDALDYDVIGPAGAYFTGDRELAPLRSMLFGGRLSYLAKSREGKSVWGLFDSVDFHLKAETLYTEPLTDTPPGGDVSGPIPDAIIAQFGLLLRY